MRKLSKDSDRDQIWWPSLFSFIGGISLPLATSIVSSQTARIALLSAALVCWVSLPLWMGYFVLKTGVLRAETSVSKRRQEPFRFWIGFVFIGALTLFISTIASVFIWATIFP